MTRALSDLEKRLGYTFRDAALLRQALVHPSSGVQPDNQRMEFLGDSLFGASLTLLLYREKPQWPEGPMTKLRHFLQGTDALCEWAKDLDLRLTLPAKSDPTQLRTIFRKPLADALEALLAAVFMDVRATGQDGFAAVFTLVEKRFLDAVRKATPEDWERRDTKTALQERAAALKLPAPVYELVKQDGPDHAPSFTVKVVVGPRVAQASARNIKLAQAEAARNLLPELTEDAPSLSRTPRRKPRLG